MEIGKGQKFEMDSEIFAIPKVNLYIQIDKRDYMLVVNNDRAGN